MKKLSVLTALLLVMALLAACGSSSGSAPAYDKSQLEPSSYAEDAFTQDIQISLASGTPGRDESVTLQYASLTDVTHTFTAVQRLEVQLDGAWYVVPDAQDFVTLQLLTLPAKSQVEDNFRFEGRYEPLPAGDYRIVKDFSDPDGNSAAACYLFTVDQ